jgi:hypothetical protein
MSEDYSREPFSVKHYLIDKKLATEEGKLICSNIFPRSSTWGLGPYYEDVVIIYLVTLIHFFEEEGMLDNLNIFITDEGGRYNILINEIDRRYDYAHPNLEWDLIMDTIEFLLPHMAGSNISYLSGNLFFNE